MKQLPPPSAAASAPNELHGPPLASSAAPNSSSRDALSIIPLRLKAPPQSDLKHGSHDVPKLKSSSLGDDAHKVLTGASKRCFDAASVLQQPDLKTVVVSCEFTFVLERKGSLRAVGAR